MKKNALTILFFLLIVIEVYSQSVIENPKTGLRLHNNLEITKVELTDSTTTLCFHTYYTPGRAISIPKETYIQPIGGEKLFIKRTDGIPLKVRYTIPPSGEVTYKLIFPAIAKTTGYIDYGEANEGGSWFIYDIQTRPMDSKSRLPKELSGNWFDKSTGNWELGFFDKYMVYKNQVWSYDFNKIKKGINSVKLTRDGKSADLFYKSTPTGSILFGESVQSLKEYGNNATEAEKIKPIEDTPYQLPVFKLDSATYSGYIKGYTPRIGVKTLSISINDIITGQQNCFVIKIAENGFFSLKLPVYYPHSCWVESAIYNGSVFLEPGKELFQLIDGSNSLLFMGESARINADMSKLMKIRSFDYRYIDTKILDMTPAQYKTYCMNCATRDRNALDSIMATNTISTKAYQVKKLGLKYGYDEEIMDYEIYFEIAYRKKNNITRSQTTLPIKIDTLTVDYFDFINQQSINNPLAVLCSGYNFYLNRVMGINVLYTTDKSNLYTLNVAEDLEKWGYTLTDSEKKLIARLKEHESVQNSNEELYASISDSIKVFHTRHYDFISKQFYRRNENLKKLFHIQQGLGFDIISIQNYFRTIVEELSPLSDMQLKAIQQKLSTPFVAEYLTVCNNQTIARLEANKKKKGSNAKDVPKTEADKVFDAIIGKYKGKVVYVDFWTTTCGPCRNAIVQIKPLKEELDGQDIAFVYITNQTSPQSTWSNMILDIKGEHYRVSNDEWNFLQAKFNISGVPHYVLVGKNGEILNPDLEHYDNDRLKRLLAKYINDK